MNALLAPVVMVLLPALTTAMVTVATWNLLGFGSVMVGLVWAAVGWYWGYLSTDTWYAASGRTPPTEGTKALEPVVRLPDKTSSANGDDPLIKHVAFKLMKMGVNPELARRIARQACAQGGDYEEAMGIAWEKMRACTNY